MKSTILLLIILGLANMVFGQIKSERHVTYWLNKESDKRSFYKNNSKDSCVTFWEEYNRGGKVVKEYDFPSDVCWKINGPWEHHYIYDNKNRITQMRNYGGEEGKERILMDMNFYSYSDPDKPYHANEFRIVYDYRAETKIGKSEIDTFYFDTANTRGMVDIFRTGWEFDTLKFAECNFIFREDFERDKSLFRPSIFSSLLGKQEIEYFEKSLINNIDSISKKLFEIYETKEKYHCLFEIEEKENQRIMKFELSQYSIDIEYKFLNENGDCYLSFWYRYSTIDNILKKSNMVKAYLEYHSE